MHIILTIYFYRLESSLVRTWSPYWSIPDSGVPPKSEDPTSRVLISKWWHHASLLHTLLFTCAPNTYSSQSFILETYDNYRHTTSSNDDPADNIHTSSWLFSNFHSSYLCFFFVVIAYVRKRSNRYWLCMVLWIKTNLWKRRKPVTLSTSFVQIPINKWRIYPQP